jgi:ATP-dependent Clp protease ATP-binding subunit ClpA
MFEDRIQNVIREIKERPNLILFIDEAHTMVGAGSALGAPSDAANVFKSVLARGEVRIIGATTLSEYKEYIQEDEALSRRFRTVSVAEPSIEETRRILYKVRPRLERNYSVRLADDAIETALEMSPRYQRHLHLPDKVIGWLDTAAVRVEIDRRWEVTADDVLDVISHASQIPKDMVFRDVGDRFKDIKARLVKRVIGQKKAIEAVAHRLVLNKGPLKDGFDRPDGVLLFLGPTGAGDTSLLPLDELAVPADGLRMAALLTAAGLTGSNSEASRKLKERAVRVDGEVVEDPQRVFAPGFEGVLQVGKRNFARVRLHAATA